MRVPVLAVGNGALSGFGRLEVRSGPAGSRTTSARAGPLRTDLIGSTKSESQQAYRFSPIRTRSPDALAGDCWRD